MNKLLTLTFLTLVFTLSAAAQECQTIDECNAKLSNASQKIEKLLDVSDAKSDEIAKLKAEINSRAAKELLDKAVIAAQAAEIKNLERVKRKRLSILFGLIKLTY